MIKIGSDFSGVGAFNQALIRLGIPHKEVFACDMDKYARQTFIHNYGEPEYYPENVYDREIPTESIDIYMTSPPCQAFSLAGRRKGEEDKRGILFYNSHEFIKENKPRYFIFENVKGLLSDDNGNTFAKWVQYLGGRSVNGNPTLFPHNESLPYHIYWKVLNAKDYNIPQNRERVFIIGIRDDEDNNFSWPKEEFLERRLKDVLESDVEEKYYLSEKMLELLTYGKIGSTEIANGTSNALTTVQKDNVVVEGVNVVANLPGKHEQNSRVYGTNGLSPTLTTMQGGGQEPKILTGFRIRKLTPRECFRLMDFPDSLLDVVNINNIINSRGILLYLCNKTTYKWNVKEKIVTGKLLQKECASSIIRGLENMEMKILNSNTRTEGIQNAQLKIAIEMFSLNKCAQAITTQIENGAILYLVKNNKVRLVKELDKELLNLTVSQDLGEKENQNTDLLLNVTLEESFLELSTYTISTMILQITNYLTYTFSLHRESTIYVTLNYKNFQKNYSDADLLVLKMGNTILSDSQLYKQAGNSICVGVLASIISKLKL